MIDNNRNMHNVLISHIEKGYKSSFVGVFEYRDTIVYAFYNDNPDIGKGYSEYFIVYHVGKSLYIANGDWLKDLKFTGIVLPSGRIIYSAYRHHFNEQEGYFVDGGLDYIRTNCDKTVELRVRDGVIAVEA